MGPRGDAILEFDWSVGEVVRALDRLRLAGNTLVIVTSDNGPVVDDGYQDRAVELLGAHKPAGPYRGGKYSAFEAGTRVPFVVRWPARVKRGVSGALVGQIDLIASLGALTGQTPATGAAPDSQNVLPALLGSTRTGRDWIVEQAGPLSIIKGRWKYIEPRQGQAVSRETNTELGNDPAPQLFDLEADIGERQNLAAAHPEKVRELAALLKKIRGTKE
jgi:arylsulfatase A-like enzyme